jgi:putative molybdopterin biosynthesis protein
VGLVQPTTDDRRDGTSGTADLPVAVPLGKGSGSVTSFGAADGFITIPRQDEHLPAGEVVNVTLLGRNLEPVDLVLQGSHCLGLDLLLEAVRSRGFTARALAVGSSSGLAAVAAGHADLAGIHLYDAASASYNHHALPPGVELLAGYGRLQGVVFRADDRRFQVGDAGTVIAGLLQQAAAGAEEAAVMIHRNRGSGTRVLVDDLLQGVRPPGFSIEARSHHAVGAAVAQGRADWGVAIEPVARLNQLGFLPLKEEQLDFAVASARRQRPAVCAFAAALSDPQVRAGLRAAGFRA